MTIPPIIYDGYGITWVVESGGPAPTFDDLNEDSNLPGAPGDDESDDEPDIFNTEFVWDPVEIRYSTFDNDFVPLGKFKLKAKVFKYIETENNLTGEKEYQAVDMTDGYELLSLKIKSEDPNSGGTWIYPDDYQENFDPNHPKQYGGVVMKNSGRSMKERGEFSVCGLDDGPLDDGIIPWIDSFRRQKEVISAYNFIDVFDQSEFSFIPMNSFVAVDLRDNEKFRFTPLYPDVMDENDKHAPIYPMNIVTRFKPDSRESVTVKYTATIEVAFRSGAFKGKKIPLRNPTANVYQDVRQDTNDYREQLEELLKFCNWNNPGEHDKEDFAPEYPISYPYTNINGYEGLNPGKEPTRRGDDKDNEKLQRGDVWYNPETNLRKYYNIADVPEKLKVKEGGTGYKNRKDVLCIWLPPDERCYKITDANKLPFGLKCDIETKDGVVISAKPSENASPSGWRDGDIVAITGGSNNARATVVIKEPPGWVDTYVRVY